MISWRQTSTIYRMVLSIKNSTITLLLLISCGTIIGQNTHLYDNSELVMPILYLKVLEDPKKSFSPKEVMNAPELRVLDKGVPNLGVSSSSFWLQFKIKNTSDIEGLSLILEQPNIDKVTLYKWRPNNNYEVEYQGEDQPFHHRNYNHPNYIFDIVVPKNETRTFLLKIQAEEQLFLPLFISTPKATVGFISNRDTVFALYTGIMLVMILYNLFIYFTVREKTYIYYVIYVSLILLTQISLKGYHFKYLLPGFPYLASKCMVIFPSLTGIFAMEFIKVFLRVGEQNVNFNKFFLVIESVFVFSILLLLIEELSPISFQIMQICTMLGSIFALYVGYHMAKLGDRPAKFFLIAWTILLLGAILFVLKDYGILPYNNFTNYTLPVGSALETILLSFALADKINTYKKERLEAIQAKEKMLAEKNKSLEAKVAFRTQKLKRTVADLIATQSQLVHAEKMAALGQLTAGIAHEINNPLNYMTQSVTILEEDFTDLKKITKKYDALLHKIPEDEKLFSAIKKHKQSTREIDTVYTDIEDSLRVISEGIEKTANISKGLTTYSRMDSTAYKRVSVEKNLEATIQLLKHEFNAKDILLERDYARPSKKVDCNPGQLNQVFTNLLNNAIYAIKHREKPSEKGCIRIITQVNPNYFVVTIRDNGMGMSAKTLSKIYDPFFTTKDVGEGTGLGLSISYGIIRNHQGSIQVDSTLNKGTSFRISLPISFQKNTQSNEEND